MLVIVHLFAVPDFSKGRESTSFVLRTKLVSNAKMSVNRARLLEEKLDRVDE